MCVKTGVRDGGGRSANRVDTRGSIIWPMRLGGGNPYVLRMWVISLERSYNVCASLTGVSYLAETRRGARPGGRVRWGKVKSPHDAAASRTVDPSLPSLTDQAQRG